MEGITKHCVLSQERVKFRRLCV